MKDWLKIIKQVLLFLTTPHPKPPPPMVPPVEKSKEAIFLDLMLHRLDEQSNTIDGLNIQTGNWLSGMGLLIAFPAILLGAERNDLSHGMIFAVYAAGLVYSIGIILLFVSALRRRWVSGPGWDEIAKASQDRRFTANDMHYSVAYFLASETLPLNVQTLSQQSRRLYLGLACVVFGVITLLIIALVNLPAHQIPEATRVIIVTPTP